MSSWVLSLLVTLPVATVEEVWPGETWSQWASPGAAGYSGERLATAHEFWASLDSAAYLVVVDGAVLVSWGEVDRRFMCHSVRKSLLSALYGIFEGEIDLDATLAELGVDDLGSLTDTEKQARVIDLISARSGVYHPAAYEPDSMKTSRPARGSHAPGTHWWYNNWDFNTAAVLFRLQTGIDMFEAFEEFLAVPLELEHFRPFDAYYHFEPGQSDHPAYPFRMSALDLARIGLLFARGGRWRDEPILSAGWVEESTSPISTTGRGRGRDGYGYMWWVDGTPEKPEGHAFHARGTGGQTITVIPALDLVLVNRTDTYAEKNVGGSSLGRLQQAIVAARTGPPESPAELGPLVIDTPSPEPRVPLTAAEQEGCLGSWTYDSGFTLTIERRDGVLVGDIDRLGTFELIARSPTRFLIADAQVPLAFEEQSDGSWRPWVEFLCALEARQALEAGNRTQLALHLERAARLFPDSATACARYGMVLHEQGDHEEALVLLRKAIELDPGVEDADRIREVLAAEDG